jgi:hypothetical protein
MLKAGQCISSKKSLKICFPSPNLGQFVSVNMACRVSQVTGRADGLRTELEGICRYAGSEVSYGEVLGDESAMDIRVTLC